MRALVEVGGSLYAEGVELLGVGATQDDRPGGPDPTSWFGRVTDWAWNALRAAGEWTGKLVYGPLEWAMRAIAGDNVLTRMGAAFTAPILGFLLIGFVLGVLASAAVRRAWSALAG